MSERDEEELTYCINCKYGYTEGTAETPLYGANACIANADTDEVNETLQCDYWEGESE